MKSLRWKFVFVAGVSLVATFAIVCAAIFGIFSTITTQRADELIEMIHDNGGAFPDIGEAEQKRGDPQPANSDDASRAEGEAESRPDGKQEDELMRKLSLTPESPFETRYCYVEFDADGAITSVDAEHLASLDRLSIADTAEGILATGRDHGYHGFYRFGVFRDAEGGGSIVVLDCRLQAQMGASVLKISAVVSAVSVVLALALLIPLSKRIMRPFAENLRRQQRFVTDASHELRTPLAVIASNTDLIEATCGESRWTESTKRQVARLDELAGAMTELARAGERREEHASGDLSAAAARAAEDFLPLAEAAGCWLHTDIEPQLRAGCSDDALERLCGILLDNAVKYCDEGGHVRIAVASRKRKTVELAVENPCASLSAEDAAHLFDRFWRADASRSREDGTGGYGIGLSIAEAIVRGCGGKVAATVDDGWFTIRATLPAA